MKKNYVKPAVGMYAFKPTNIVTDSASGGTIPFESAPERGNPIWESDEE